MDAETIGHIMGPIGKFFHLGGAATAAVAGTTVAANSTTLTDQTGGLAVGISALVIATIPLVSKELEARRAERAARRAEERADRDRNLQGQLEAAQARLHELEGRAATIEDKATTAAVKAEANTARQAGTDGKIEAVRSMLVDQGYFAQAPKKKPGSGETWPRLLLVEDDPNTARLLTFIFTEENFEVVHAATVVEALDMLKLSPAWVVLDLRMGGEDGADVLRKVRADGLAIKVIVTTGESDPGRLAPVKTLKPDALLYKPIDYDELIRTVRGKVGPVPG